MTSKTNRKTNGNLPFSPQEIQSAATADLSRFSNWAIIGERFLDTEFPEVYHERCREELVRRGYSETEIAEMYALGKRTLAWLNFNKCNWNWVALDDKDIALAINWQRSERLITKSQKARMLATLRKYGSPDAEYDNPEIEHQHLSHNVKSAFLGGLVCGLFTGLPLLWALSHPLTHAAALWHTQGLHHELVLVGIVVLCGMVVGWTSADRPVRMSEASNQKTIR